MSTFEIDFDQLCFLAEATIQPTPIARHWAWMQICDTHYHKMSQEERNKLFDWIQKSSKFDLSNKDNQYFYARFNPDNQYRVQTEFQGQTSWHECFLFNNRYSITKATTIADEYIIKVEKL